MVSNAENLKVVKSVHESFNQTKASCKACK